MYFFFNVGNIWACSAVNDANEYPPGSFDESYNLAMCIVSPPNPFTSIPWL